jgi:hypothetical protein
MIDRKIVCWALAAETVLAMLPLSFPCFYQRSGAAMKTALALALIVLATPTVAAAADEIPAKYRGEWCFVKGTASKEGAAFKRCRDRYENDDDGGMRIRAREIWGLETGCRVIKVTAVRIGHELEEECSTKSHSPIPTSGSELMRQTTRLRLSGNGRRLISILVRYYGPSGWTYL